MKTILADCTACGATGLYQGFAEKDGYPVVCLECEGTGAKKISYEPFTGRKDRRGIKMVKLSRGRFIATGVGGMDNTEMTYEQFKNKFKPPNP